MSIKLGSSREGPGGEERKGYSGCKQEGVEVKTQQMLFQIDERDDENKRKKNSGTIWMYGSITFT